MRKARVFIRGSVSLGANESTILAAVLLHHDMSMFTHGIYHNSLCTLFQPLYKQLVERVAVCFKVRK